MWWQKTGRIDSSFKICLLYFVTQGCDDGPTRAQQRSCSKEATGEYERLNGRQAQCHWDGNKHPCVSSSHWRGIQTHRAVAWVGTVGSERFKAHSSPRHFILDPRLKFRHSGIDLRVIGPVTTWPENGDAGLDPLRMLHALQRSSRVTLGKHKTFTDSLGLPLMLWGELKVGGVGDETDGGERYLTCCLAFWPYANHVVSDGLICLWVAAAARLVSDDGGASLLQRGRARRGVCGGESVPINTRQPQDKQSESHWMWNPNADLWVCVFIAVRNFERRSSGVW